MAKQNTRAGKLRVRYYLQAQDGTTTDRGQRDNSEDNWDTEATIWGSLETLSGTELEAANKLYAEATHRVQIRYRAGVTPQHRLQTKRDERILHIGHVADPEHRHRQLVLLCKEEV